MTAADPRQPSQIWSAQLNANGTSIVGTPDRLADRRPAALPWETTTDDPQMSSRRARTTCCSPAVTSPPTSYNEALTTCSGPLGPCSQPAAPFLTTYGTAYGPGGGALFQDAKGNWWLGYAAWSLPCTSYSCGAVRELYTAPIDLSNGLSLPCNPPSGTPVGYRFTASDGGIFTYGNQPFCGSTGGIHINQPVVGIANTADDGGYWTVARDGGIFSFGDATFYGSTGSIHLNQPDRGHGRHARRRWLLAGGLRRRHLLLRRRQFYGSTGSIHLNQPIVGMAATPDGGGYWLVASDGGIFSYGDATFYGSTGSIHLNQPIVGMAATPDGHGLLAGGLRRRHLHLRRRHVLRLDRIDPPQQAHRRHGGHARRARATGWWPRTAASSPTATPRSTARPDRSISTPPSWR